MEADAQTHLPSAGASQRQGTLSEYQLRWVATLLVGVMRNLVVGCVPRVARWDFSRISTMGIAHRRSEVLSSGIRTIMVARGSDLTSIRFSGASVAILSQDGVVISRPFVASGLASLAPFKCIVGVGPRYCVRGASERRPIASTSQEPSQSHQSH